MNKKALIALAVIVLLGIAGAAAYAFITSPTKAPSSTPTSQTPPERPMGGQPQTPAPEASAPSTDSPSGTYRIIPESSKASFSIFEMLRGEPKTVVGTTSNISGYFDANPSDLTEASISAIRINARTFQTDSNQRDNTTRRAILKTEDDANEFIVFTPSAMEGLPASAKIGDEVTYRITGDLLVSGITKEATFEGKGKFISDTEFNGTASTTVLRSDYNLIVPSFPFLADVADIVSLQIDFVAKK
jgi:polyisoprenoid-binding protein YceI